jgi:hypothetical protein
VSRNVSATARAAIYAAQTDAVFLQLIEIDHEDLEDPLRFVNNTESVVHGGNTYLPFPFRIDLPDEKEDTITNATLTIDNVDRQIVTAVRTLATAPTITWKLVLASSPDTVEAGPFEFVLRNVRYSLYTVSGELVYEDRLNLEIPKLKFTPEYFGGLF